METLALELSKILEITFEKAMELLPIISEQFIRYRIISVVRGWTILFFAVSLCTLITIIIIYFLNCEYEDESNKNSNWSSNRYGHRAVTTSRKLLKPSGIVTVISGALLFITQILPYIMTPEFMLIKEFIGR